MLKVSIFQQQHGAIEYRIRLSNGDLVEGCMDHCPNEAETLIEQIKALHTNQIVHGIDGIYARMRNPISKDRSCVLVAIRAGGWH